MHSVRKWPRFTETRKWPRHRVHASRFIVPFQGRVPLVSCHCFIVTAIIPLRRGKFPDRSIRHVPVRSIEIERDRSLRLRVSRRGQIRSVLHPRTKEDLARSVCEG